MFIDETEIKVSSGHGGAGMLSFRREKYVPRGGPDGGDGGRGGHVVLRSTRHKNTLAGIRHRQHFRADGGRPGGSSLKHGKNGDDIVIDLPVGTLVRDAERGHVLRDMDRDGLELVLVRGGAGGRGNKHFAGSTNQTPRHATAGKEGETRALRLELRLVADVGLVGLPNAGKSTFLRTVSAARPKVADYPFTTLEPVLGLVSRNDDGLLIADIPGLVEGAHEGAGLGHRFLRHVQRTRVLLHLVDAIEGAEAAVAAWHTVREELVQSGHDLHLRPTVVALSRSDTIANAEEVARALSKVTGAPVHVLSAQTRLGVDEVLDALTKRLEEVAELGKS